MKKFLFIPLFFIGMNAWADRWIVYNATYAVNCNGGVLTMSGADAYCTNTVVGYSGGISIYGSLYLSSAAATQTNISTTPVITTIFNKVGLSNYTVPSVGAGTITMSTPTICSVSANFSSTSTANILGSLYYQLRVNGSTTNITATISSTTMTTSFGGIVSLSSGDVVSVYIAASSVSAPSGTIYFKDAALNVAALGTMGPMGPPGPTGLTGANGTNGSAGPTGPTGGTVNIGTGTSSNFTNAITSAATTISVLSQQITLSSIGTTSFWQINCASITCDGQNIPTANIAPGILPSNVVVSSVAVGSVLDASIVAVSGAKITGTVADTNLSANVDLLNAAQSASATKTFLSGVSASTDVVTSSMSIGTSNFKKRLTLVDNQSGSTTPGTNPIVWIGGGNTNNNTLSEIGFTYGAVVPYVEQYTPATIGYQITTSGGYTSGDLVFCTRSVNTDTPPSEGLRIASNGAVIAKSLLLLPDGSAAAPSAAWASNTNTGLYKIGPNEVGVSAGGTSVLEISNSKFISSDLILAPNGTSAVPSYTFGSDQTMGLSKPGPGQLAVSIGGAPVSTFTATTVFMPSITWPNSTVQVSGPSAIYPASSTVALPLGFSSSTGTITSLSPGVMHIIATSSNVVTALVSLSTETTGTLADANLTANVDLLNSTQTVSANKTFSHGFTSQLVSTFTSISVGSGISYTGTAGTQGSTQTVTTGNVGEHLNASNSSGVNSPGTGQWFDIVSINLSTGDWDVTGQVIFQLNGAVQTVALMAVTSNMGNSSSGQVDGDNRLVATIPTAAGNTAATVANYQVVVSAATPYYLKARCDFTGGPAQAYGRISARRAPH